MRWEGKLGYDQSQGAAQGELKIGGKLEVTISLGVKAEPGQNYKAITKDKKEYGVKGTAGITGDFVIELEQDDDEYGVFSHFESTFCDLEIIFYSKTTVEDCGKTTTVDDKKDPIIEDENINPIKAFTLINSFEIGKTDKKRII